MTPAAFGQRTKSFVEGKPFFIFVCCGAHHNGVNEEKKLPVGRPGVIFTRQKSACLSGFEDLKLDNLD